MSDNDFLSILPGFSQVMLIRRERLQSLLSHLAWNQMSAMNDHRSVFAAMNIAPATLTRDLTLLQLVYNFIFDPEWRENFTDSLSEKSLSSAETQALRLLGIKPIVAGYLPAHILQLLTNRQIPLNI